MIDLDYLYKNIIRREIVTDYKLVTNIQSTPLNRVTLVPEHFDPIKRNLGVDPIKRSELMLFLWFCSWPSDSIKRSRLYINRIYLNGFTIK